MTRIALVSETASPVGETASSAVPARRSSSRRTEETRLLAGKVALVTGGGRGLGREICSALAGAGAAVVVADVHRELAEAAARELSEDGATVLALSIDVAGEASVATALDEVREHLGRVDILVNNAGTDRMGSLEEISVEQWTRVLDVSLVGPFLTARGVFPAMRAPATQAGTWGLLGSSSATRAVGRRYESTATALASGGTRTLFLPGATLDGAVGALRDARDAAGTVFVVSRPRDAVIPELTLLPMVMTA